jgi:hypothetical protein
VNVAARLHCSQQLREHTPKFYKMQKVCGDTV